jgi:hypothetical protein
MRTISYGFFLFFFSPGNRRCANDKRIENF